MSDRKVLKFPHCVTFTVADRKEAIFSTEQSQTNIFDAEKTVIGDLFSSDDDDEEEEIEKNVEKDSLVAKTGENENDEEDDIATGELFSSENDWLAWIPLLKKMVQFCKWDLRKYTPLGSFKILYRPGQPNWE